jgi:hypothetical protein
MGGDAIEAELARHLIEIVRAAPSLMRVLITVRARDLAQQVRETGS